MTKQGYPSGQTRGHGPAAVVRPEHSTTDDERPFGEFRKNLNDVVRLVFLHRWAFFIPCCLVASAAFVISLYVPRAYRSRTSFERHDDPILVNLPSATGTGSFKHFRTTMTRDVVSSETLCEAMDNLGLTDHLERNEDGTFTPEAANRRFRMARMLGSQIIVSPISPSEHVDIVRLTFHGPEPGLGTRLLDQVKKTYIRQTKIRMREFLESQRDYVMKEDNEALEKLRLARRAETRFRLENPHVNPADPGLISTKISQLEIERRGLAARQREYEAELDANKQMLATVEVPVESARHAANQGESVSVENYISPTGLRMMAKLQDINTKVDTLRATRGMTDEHPQIQALLTTRRSIESYLGAPRRFSGGSVVSNAALDAGTVSATGAPMRPWQGERARLVVRLDSLNSKLKDVAISLESNELSLGQLQQAKKDVYEKQEEHAIIQAAIGKAEKRHSTLLAGLSTIEPAIKAIDQDRLVQFSEGTPARGGSKPFTPKASTVVLMAILAGVLAGTVFVVLAEVLDNVYRSSGHVSRSLGLPILETIDEIITSRDRRRLLIRKTVTVPALVLFCLGTTGVTGSMAYLSVKRPQTYQRLKAIPEAAIQFLTGGDTDDQEVAS